MKNNEKKGKVKQQDTMEGSDSTENKLTHAEEVEKIEVMVKVRYWDHDKENIVDYIFDYPMDKDTGLIRVSRTKNTINISVFIEHNVKREKETHSYDRDRGLVIPPGGLIIKL